MTSRQLIKAAIAHVQTDRVPYLTDFTQEARESFARAKAARKKTPA